MKILSTLPIAVLIVSVIAKPAGPDAEVNAMLDKLNYYKAWDIIRNYSSEECNENETAIKFSKYFAENDTTI